MILWDMPPWIVAGVHQRFGQTFDFDIQGRSIKEGSKFLRKYVKHRYHDVMAQHTPKSSFLQYFIYIVSIFSSVKPFTVSVSNILKEKIDKKYTNPMVIPSNTSTDSADKYVGCNHYESSLVCTLLVCVMFNEVTNLLLLQLYEGR